jgi:hypothetical protein
MSFENTYISFAYKRLIMILNILISFLLQIAFTIGVIFIFGLIIALCNRLFYSNFGYSSRIICYVTGFIGTPIHELSHALFCIIFGHKIVDIKLFQINSDDGTLGYVNHTYNPRNIYQIIGNFFIGIAPIVVITGILYLIAYFLLPDMAAQMLNSTNNIDITQNAATCFTDIVTGIFACIVAFFSYIVTWQWWIFVLVGLLLALHMNLSPADIKSSLGGLFFLILLILIADIILGVISENLLSSFTNIVISIGSYMITFFMLALIFSVIAVLISLIVRLISRIKNGY